MKTEIVNFNSINAIALTPTEDTLYTILCHGNGRDQKLLTVNLDVPDVACKIYCGYKVSLGNAIDLVTTIVHKAPATNCNTVIRRVLYDGGVSSYQGKVIIRKTAHGSVSRLEDRVLVIGETTHNHAEPIMQIEANDVIASHASTTGRVDENQLYYLQSRGLSRKESQDLLVEAFLVCREV